MARTAEKLDKVTPDKPKIEFDPVDTIKKQKAPGKSNYKMQPSLDIIKQSYLREAGDEKGYDQFMRKLASLLQNPDIRLVRFLNTMFLIMKISDEVAEIKIFTIDPPDLIAITVRDAAQLLQKNGFKKAVSASNLPAYVEVAKQTGLPVKISQGQMVMGNQAVPSYVFELDLQ